MSEKNIKISNFEGPFDLLLRLVTSKRVDISSISINEIADQYLAEVSNLIMIDLETASDFMVVASTLLEIKAHYLLPKKTDAIYEEVEQLSPLEAREVLIEKLICYKQFKNVAKCLEDMETSESRYHTRLAGPTPDFRDWQPDYLHNVDLSDIAKSALVVLSKTDQFLLNSKHIASKPIPVEVYVNSILSKIKIEKKIKFSKLVENAKTRDIVVVSFLALLELIKREYVTTIQDTQFGDIDITFNKDGVVVSDELDDKLVDKAKEVL